MREGEAEEAEEAEARPKLPTDESAWQPKAATPPTLRMECPCFELQHVLTCNSWLIRIPSRWYLVYFTTTDLINRSKGFLVF